MNDAQAQVGLERVEVTVAVQKIVSIDHRVCRMDTPLILLDTVIAAAGFPEHNVLAGDLGASVEVYTTPSLAYEVEFVNPDGLPRALLTLAPSQVRQPSPAGVLTTRQMALVV